MTWVVNVYAQDRDAKPGLGNLKELEQEIELLKSPKGYLYAGLPKFKALFGRDSLITGWELMEWRGDFPNNAVRALSELQGRRTNLKTGERSGKIPHEHFDSYSEYIKRKREVKWIPKGPNYFSVDSTPLYVIVACLQLEHFPRSIKGEIQDSIVKALKFLVDNAGLTGFLTYEKNDSTLQSQSWRDGIGDILNRLKSPVATVGAQGYLFKALDSGLDLTKGDRRHQSELMMSMKQHISDLPDLLETRFWIDENSYYALATDGDGVAERAITSDPGHLLFSGVLSKRRERDVIDALFDSDMITDYGIRTLSTKDRRFDAKAYQRGSIWPQDNWIIAGGLKSRGYLNQYREIREKVLYAYERMGKMPEYFGVDRGGKLIPAREMRVVPCYPQSWSTGAIISFLIERESEVTAGLRER